MLTTFIVKRGSCSRASVSSQKFAHKYSWRGRPAGKAFIESLRVFSHLANVGDAKSLVIHPATTTHHRMSDADLKKAGITAGTVRLSIGLEATPDLIDDLDRALMVSQK